MLSRKKQGGGGGKDLASFIVLLVLPATPKKMCISKFDFKLG